MFCTRCGAPNGDEWAHCSRCGAPLKKIEPLEEVATPAPTATPAPVEPAPVEPAPTAPVATVPVKPAPTAPVEPAPTAPVEPALVEPRPVPPMGSGSVVVPPQYPPAPKAASSSKLPIIVAIIVALAIIGAAAAFASGAFGPRDNSTSASEHAVSTSAREADEEDEDPAAEEDEAAAEAAETESQDDAESESSSAAEEETPAPVSETPPASRVLDLSDAGTYAQVNTFISNFSEVEMGDMPDVSMALSEDLATFAVKHVGRNSFNEWEQAPSSNPGWGLPRDDKWSGGPNGMRGWRLSANRVDELVTRYFGRSIDFTEIAVNQHPGWVVYEDGYVFFGTTNGASWPGGVALAKAAYDLPDGTVEIEFDVYNNFGYDATDQSLYSCTPAQIMDRLGVDGPIATGVAVVRQGTYNEYTGGLVLVSYSTSKV